MTLGQAWTASILLMLVTALIGYLIGRGRGYKQGTEVKDRYDHGYRVGISVGWAQAISATRRRYEDMIVDPRYYTVPSLLSGFSLAVSYLAGYWEDGGGGDPHQVAGDHEDP